MNMERDSLIGEAHRKRGVIISNSELVMKRLTDYQVTVIPTCMVRVHLSRAPF